MTDAEKIKKLEADFERMRAAIRQHRVNVWGDDRILQDEDVSLYRAADPNAFPEYA